MTPRLKRFCKRGHDRLTPGAVYACGNCRQCKSVLYSSTKGLYPGSLEAEHPQIFERLRSITVNKPPVPRLASALRFWDAVQ